MGIDKKWKPLMGGPWPFTGEVNQSVINDSNDIRQAVRSIEEKLEDHSHDAADIATGTLVPDRVPRLRDFFEGVRVTTPAAATVAAGAPHTVSWTVEDYDLDPKGTAYVTVPATIITIPHDGFYECVAETNWERDTHATPLPAAYSNKSIPERHNPCRQWPPICQTCGRISFIFPR